MNHKEQTPIEEIAERLRCAYSTSGRHYEVIKYEPLIVDKGIIKKATVVIREIEDEETEASDETDKQP